MSDEVHVKELYRQIEDLKQRISAQNKEHFQLMEEARSEYERCDQARISHKKMISMQRDYIDALYDELRTYAELAGASEDDLPKMFQRSDT